MPEGILNGGYYLAGIEQSLNLLFRDNPHGTGAGRQLYRGRGENQESKNRREKSGEKLKGP